MRRLALRGAALGGAAGMAAVVLELIAAREGPAPLAGALTFLAAVAIGLAGGYLAFRGPAGTVDDVTAAARRMAAGQFGESVPLAGGAAGQLASAFNTMSRQIEALLDTVAADQARLEAVFDASTDATVAMSRDTTVRLLNQAASQMFAAEPHHALGRPFIETARDYELDGLVRRVAAGDGPGETLVITFGPARQPLRAAAVPITGGGDWAVLLMLTDLTEVQRVDHMRRDFIGNVSHELRTPLAAIRALVETIETGAAAPGAETEAFLGRIHRQVDRLTALVNELLDLSRIESGAVDLHPEEIDLARLAAEAASLLQTRLEARRVQLSLPPTPGPVVEADRPSLLRVLTNLLDNAAKFSPEEGEVSVTLRAEDGLVAVAVRDHGRGISPQALPRVFERFYKGDASRAEEGVGLGLAIVKHIVRSHGGTVDVQSAPGEGATFTVRLPRTFSGATPEQHARVSR